MFFLFLFFDDSFFWGEIPVEDDGKNGEIIVDPLVDFLGEFRIFLFLFSYIREYGIRRRNWIDL